MDARVVVDVDDPWAWEPDDPMAITQRMSYRFGARILVAEDDPEMRGLVVSALREDGYDVIASDSGDDLVGLLASIARDDAPMDGVDLVILDNRMPGLLGLDVVRALRLSSWKTPVILMTAFPDADVLAEARQLRAAVLAKPFGMEALSHAAVAALARRDGDNDVSPG